jgi:hypothetical protein
MGKIPRTKARHVSPNAKAGLPGNVLDIATKVIGIVILKRNMPIIAIYGILAPKTSRGRDKISAPTAILIRPNLSARNPQIPLPKTIATVNRIRRLTSVFQGNIMVDQTSERIIIDKKINHIIKPKYVFLVLPGFL